MRNLRFEKNEVLNYIKIKFLIKQKNIDTFSGYEVNYFIYHMEMLLCKFKLNLFFYFVL